MRGRPAREALLRGGQDLHRAEERGAEPFGGVGGQHDLAVGGDGGDFGQADGGEPGQAVGLVGGVGRLAHLDAGVVLGAQVERVRGLHIGPPSHLVGHEAAAQCAGVPCVELGVATSVVVDRVDGGQGRRPAPPGIVLGVAAVGPAAVRVLLAQDPAAIVDRVVGQAVVDTGAGQVGIVAQQQGAERTAAREHARGAGGIRHAAHVPGVKVNVGEARATAEEFREVADLARVPARDRVVVLERRIVLEKARQARDARGVPGAHATDHREFRVIGKEARERGDARSEGEVGAVEGREGRVAREPALGVQEDRRAVHLNRGDRAEAGDLLPGLLVSRLGDDLVRTRVRADGQGAGGVLPPGVLVAEAAALERAIEGVGERLGQIVARGAVAAVHHDGAAEPGVGGQTPDAARLPAGADGLDAGAGQDRLLAQGQRRELGVVLVHVGEVDARRTICRVAHVPATDVDRGQACTVREHGAHVGRGGRVPVLDVEGRRERAHVVEHMREVPDGLRLPARHARQARQGVAVVEEVGEVGHARQVPGRHVGQGRERRAVAEHPRHARGMRHVHLAEVDGGDLGVALEPARGVLRRDVALGDHGVGVGRRGDAPPGQLRVLLGHGAGGLVRVALVDTDGEGVARGVVGPPGVLGTLVQEVAAGFAGLPVVEEATLGTRGRGPVATREVLGAVVPQAVSQLPAAVDRTPVGDAGVAEAARDARAHLEDHARAQDHGLQARQAGQHVGVGGAGPHLPRVDVEDGDAGVALEHGGEVRDEAHVPAAQIDVRERRDALEHVGQVGRRQGLPIGEVVERLEGRGAVEHVGEVGDAAHVPVHEVAQVRERRGALEEA